MGVQYGCILVAANSQQLAQGLCASGRLILTRRGLKSRSVNFDLELLLLYLGF